MELGTPVKEILEAGGAAEAAQVDRRICVHA